MIGIRNWIVKFEGFSGFSFEGKSFLFGQEESFDTEVDIGQPRLDEFGGDNWASTE